MMTDLNRRIIERCTPAYNEALEIVSSEDDDKILGALTRLTPKVVDGDIDAIMQMLFIQLIQEEELKGN